MLAVKHIVDRDTHLLSEELYYCAHSTLSFVFAIAYLIEPLGMPRSSANAALGWHESLPNQKEALRCRESPDGWNLCKPSGCLLSALFVSGGSSSNLKVTAQSILQPEPSLTMPNPIL